jgi:hypothetical protein
MPSVEDAAVELGPSDIYTNVGKTILGKIAILNVSAVDEVFVILIDLITAELAVGTE